MERDNQEKPFAIMRRKRKQIQKLKSHSSITGVTYSQKNGELVQFESSLEADVTRLLEFDDSVLNYSDHPFSIEFEYKGNTHIYTPDFYVELIRGRGKVEFSLLGVKSQESKWLIEVKYRETIEKLNEFEQYKFKVVQELCESQGIFFTFIDESIRDVYLKNIRRLKRFKNDIILENWDKTIQPLLKSKIDNCAEIGELITKVGESERDELLRSIWVLLANDFISCDLYSVINYKTKIKLEYEG